MLGLMWWAGGFKTIIQFISIIVVVVTGGYGIFKLTSIWNNAKKKWDDAYREHKLHETKWPRK